MRPEPGSPVAGQVAQAARDSYGRIVAWLSRRFGNLTDAEDAMSAALEAALLTWPKTGQPRSPEAWLLTTARRRMLDRLKRDQTISASADLVAHLDADRLDATALTLPDHRLSLLLVCAHPAIDPAIRAPLMLQTVLGLDARRIAQAFLVPPGTMSVRLSRAKTKIAAARIPFSEPPAQELPARLEDVLDAIYAAYTLGQDRLAPDPDDLSAEALWLVSLAARLVPDSAATHGLFALILFGMARRGARLDAQGRYVPLSRQDPGLWDQRLLADARRALRNAQRGATPGRYPLEATIEAVQVDGLACGRTDWDALLSLYRALEAISPTPGVACARIAVQSRLTGPATALAALDARPESAYQPYWAVRADLLARLGRPAEAATAYVRAAALTEAGPVRDWLLAQSAPLPP